MSPVEGLDWLSGVEEPLEATTDVKLAGWEEVAIASPERFAADLTALGIPPSQVEEGVALGRDAQAEIATAVEAYWASQPLRYADTPPEREAEVQQVYSLAYDGALRRIADWLAGRKLEVVESNLEKVNVPLFVLSAPDRPRACVTFKAEATQKRKIGWSVEVAGTGLGSEATITTTVSSAFTAGPGEFKTVFLPLTVSVERVRVQQRGATVGTRVNVERLADQHPVPGILRLDPGSYPKAGEHEQTYEIAGDPSGAIATYGYSYDQAKVPTVKLGVKAFGADLSVSCEATLETAVSLTFELPGGKDYELYRTAGTDGVMWTF